MHVADREIAVPLDWSDPQQLAHAHRVRPRDRRPRASSRGPTAAGLLPGRSGRKRAASDRPGRMGRARARHTPRRLARPAWNRSLLGGPWGSDGMPRDSRGTGRAPRPGSERTRSFATPSTCARASTEVTAGSRSGRATVGSAPHLPLAVPAGTERLLRHGRPRKRLAGPARGVPAHLPAHGGEEPSVPLALPRRRRSSRPGGRPACSRRRPVA
jgi:hypothetical protein